MSVYEILFPPDETQYKGMVHLAVLNKDKEMKSLGSCIFEDLPKRIEKMEFLKSRNCKDVTIIDTIKIFYIQCTSKVHSYLYKFLLSSNTLKPSIRTSRYRFYCYISI